MEHTPALKWHASHKITLPSKAFITNNETVINHRRGRVVRGWDTLTMFEVMVSAGVVSSTVSSSEYAFPSKF